MRVTTVVENTLRDYPATRNSDRKLLLMVWHTLGFVLTPTQRLKFMTMPNSETIRRVRQKIQENGKYLADPSISKERHDKSLTMQQNAPSANPERIEQISEGNTKTRPPKIDDLEIETGTLSSKGKYIFKQQFDNFYIKGREYDLSIAPLAVGKPVVVLLPDRREYVDVKAFSNFWGIAK